MKPATAAVVVSGNVDTAGATLAICRTKFCVPCTSGNYRKTKSQIKDKEEMFNTGVAYKNLKNVQSENVWKDEDEKK